MIFRSRNSFLYARRKQLFAPDRAFAAPESYTAFNHPVSSITTEDPPSYELKVMSA